MNKLFLPICVILFLLISCQSEEIVSKSGQAGSRKSNAVAEAEITSVSQSNSSDPNYMEPIDPETGGTGGGDVNFVMPPPIAIDNGQPLVASGNNGGMFTQSGGLDDDLIGFTTAEPGVDRPLIIAPNARGLWMGFTFVANGTRFFVRA